MLPMLPIAVKKAVVVVAVYESGRFYRLSQLAF